MPEKEERQPEQGFTGYQFRRAVRKAVGTLTATTWTPTIAQGATAMSYNAGASRCEYAELGDFVLLSVELQFSSAGPAGGGDLFLTNLPVAALAPTNPAGIGAYRFRDDSGTASTGSVCLRTDGVTLDFRDDDGTLLYQGTALASGDEFSFTVWYRKA